MNDRDFLMWVHARLQRRGDDELLDFMHRLRAIIAATPADRVSPNTGEGDNNLGQLRQKLGMGNLCPRCAGSGRYRRLGCPEEECVLCRGNGSIEWIRTQEVPT